MEEKEFNIGDIVRHVYLGRGMKIYVANATSEKILGRYMKEGIIHSIELFNHEVELYVNEPVKAARNYF